MQRLSKSKSSPFCIFFSQKESFLTHFLFTIQQLNNVLFLVIDTTQHFLAGSMKRRGAAWGSFGQLSKPRLEHAFYDCFGACITYQNTTIPCLTNKLTWFTEIQKVLPEEKQLWAYTGNRIKRNNIYSIDFFSTHKM